METDEILDELSDLARAWENSKRAIDFIESAQSRVYVLRKQRKADLDKIVSLEKQFLAMNEEIEKLRAEKASEHPPQSKPVRNIFTDPREGDRFKCFNALERVIRFSENEWVAFDEYGQKKQLVNGYIGCDITDIRPVQDAPEQAEKAAEQILANDGLTQKKEEPKTAIYGFQECDQNDLDFCFMTRTSCSDEMRHFKLVPIEGKR